MLQILRSDQSFIQLELDFENKWDYVTGGISQLNRTIL